MKIFDDLSIGKQDLIPAEIIYSSPSKSEESSKFSVRIPGPEKTISPERNSNS